MRFVPPQSMTEEIDSIIREALSHDCTEGILLSRSSILIRLIPKFPSLSVRVIRRGISSYLNPKYRVFSRYNKNRTWIIRPAGASDQCPALTSCNVCPYAVKGEGVPGREIMICSRSGRVIHSYPIRPKGCPRVTDVQ